MINDRAKIFRILEDFLRIFESDCYAHMPKDQKSKWDKFRKIFDDKLQERFTGK